MPIDNLDDRISDSGKGLRIALGAISKKEAPYVLHCLLVAFEILAIR